MIDLHSQAFIDKNALLGGCVRLRLSVDAECLRAKVAALPASMWGTTAGRVGVHNAAEALFLRGYAPAEGDKPIEDRPALDQLPYVRSIIEQVIPAQPLRALLARLPAGATIAPHVDKPAYFSKTLRLHIPIESNDQVWMLCAGFVYQMHPGEIWVLNNSTEHGVWNRHASRARTHLICDFLPTPELVGLVREGDRNLGQPVRDSGTAQYSVR